MQHFSDLRLLLEKRLDVIADHTLREANPMSHLDQLREVSEAIDLETAVLADRCPPRLRHFLENASYAKALAFITETEADTAA